MLVTAVVWMGGAGLKKITHASVDQRGHVLARCSDDHLASGLSINSASDLFVKVHSIDTHHRSTT